MEAWSGRGDPDFFFNRLDQGRRRFAAVDFAFYKFAEGFFLAEDFKIGGVGLYFPQQFSLGAFGQLIVEIHCDFSYELLIVLISHY